MKILCAIDGSRYSRWVLEALKRIDMPSESSVELLHVIDRDQWPPNKHMSSQAKEAIQKGLVRAHASGHAFMTSAEKAVFARGISAHGHVMTGRPVDTIVRFARRRQCDLVVLGCRGLTAFRPFLLGSVSRRVVMDAPCSVMIVKRRLKAVHRVLIGVDGSKDARGAVELFLRLLPSKDIHATVVSVVPPLPLESDVAPDELATLLRDVQRPLEDDARTLAKQLAERLCQTGMKVDTSVVHGHIGRALVEAAQSSSADLMVIGSRGLTGATRYLMGSVADTVVKYAPCPILVFRRS